MESFITQYKPYAIEVEILARAEGSPLVECIVKQKVIHFLERTGPYLSTPGKHAVILNCTVPRFEKVSTSLKQFESQTLSQLKANGLVLDHQEKSAVVDVGISLVVSSLEGFGDVAVGDWISFESQPPLHGFVLSKTPPLVQRRIEDDADSL